MEPNPTGPNQSPNPKGTCQKILDSFSDCPSLCTIRHISRSRKENSSVSSASAKPDIMQHIVAEGSQSVLTPGNRKATKEVHVRYEIPVSHSLPHEKGNLVTAKESVDAQAVESTRHEIVNPGKTQRQIFKPKMVLPAEEEGEELQHANTNDKFSDYIHRVKMKFRTTSHVGDKKRVSRLDSFNDKVSTYISRAKAKLRTTTHVWDDSNASPK